MNQKLQLSGILDSIRQRHTSHKDSQTLAHSISNALSTNKDKFERVDSSQRKGAWRFTKSYRPRSSSSIEKPSTTNGKCATPIRLPSLSDCDEVFTNQSDPSPLPRSDEKNLNQKPPFSYSQLIVQAISKVPNRQELVE